MEKITAMVPMKGHSERVPNKNMRLFHGKPLFYWILCELRAAVRVGRIVVNTDNIAIKNAVRSLFDDIRIIIRPESLCGDDVSMNKIIDYDIHNELADGEHYIQTHSTNPLLRHTTIDAAVETYFVNLGVFDSLFSVSRVQTRCYTENGHGINHNSNELLPTQQLTPIYVENSNFYIFSKKSFDKCKRRIGETPYLFEMSAYEAIDIDDEDDFIHAEHLHRARRKKGD
jgi:CMP-N-acetylneuraminic acid synthetase